jgi:hypothetical protein
MTRKGRVLTATLLLAAAATISVEAVKQPDRAVDSLLFAKPETIMRPSFARASEIAGLAGDPRFAALGVAANRTIVDQLTGRLATVYPATPLLPGRGVGNSLSWAAGVPDSPIALEQAAGEAFRAYLQNHAAALGVAMDELAWPGKVTALSDELVNIHIPRQIAGIEVLNNQLTASIKHGNLILVGTDNWADFDGVAVPSLSANDAAEVLRRHVGERLYGNGLRAPYLVYVPLRAGDGITYRLAWVLHNDLGETGGRFEAIVDAVHGELLSLQDKIHWASRRAQGGVYPVANDQTAPDGVEQAGWPMPFSTVISGPYQMITDIGGNTPLCVDGSATARLSGPFIDMNDNCGAESLTASTDILDWLSGPTGAATDCTTPGVGGPGNTKASRTGFHELNMIRAMGASQLPANAWLQQQLTANMNVNAQCNANWTGTVVNFFRSGGGCNNTGEIAGIFDHEWGHGMDDNDAVPSVSNPGEGIADIYANLRLNDSCVGRGFDAAGVPGGLCGGYGDPCTVASGCTGVRDTDWANRASGLPHDILWINNNCPSTGGPCGSAVHCEGAVYAEAVWDLWNRDLTAGAFNYDLDRAREVATFLTYTGATAVGPQWFTCDVTDEAPPGPAGGEYDGGCGATTGYQKYLVADDDNGNLADGTPHMSAIAAAFQRHKIACSTNTVTDSGCAGAPASAPTVTPTARDKGIDLSWTSVAGATEYEIYRTDGVFGCNFGKIKVGTTAGTTFEDRGLQNGRTYSYSVIPKGGSDSCFGPASTCASIAPSAAGGPGGGSTVALSAFGDTPVLDVLGGDADFFLDNCEVLKIVLPLGNTGTTTLTNIQITDADSTSHASSALLTSLPKVVAASLPPCQLSGAVVEFHVQGLAAGDTFEADIELTATELGGPQVVHVVAENLGTEGDFQTTATKTWNFNVDAEGWVTEAGTFVRSNSGPGTPGNDSFFFQSSNALGNQCDVVRSPTVKLSATSTLSLSNHFDIEPFYAPGGVWYDRANIVYREASNGNSTLLTPSSGRAYNASGANGTCGTEGQAGWAGAATTWAASNWTSGALQTGTLANKPGNLVVRYGTDPLAHPSGFRFDLVTLTNFDLAVADTQGNSCVATNLIFADGYETGNLVEWSSSQP